MRKTTDKNRLSLVNPHLSVEWNYEKNFDVVPEGISYSSKKKVWWRCEKNHEWEATPSDRHHKSSGCPYCNGRKPTEKTCLSAKNPTISKEWNYEKNEDIDPHRVTEKSGKKVWWKCENGHEWEAVIRHRSNGSGCPYCSGRKVTPENSFGKLFNKLLSEWDYSRNKDIDPYKTAQCSHKKVWWKCKNGHQWKAIVKSRTIRGDGCPHCKKIILNDGTEWDSFAEAYMYINYKIENTSVKFHERYGQELGKCTYDFFIPSENKYIEVTAFDKKNNYSIPQYIKYLRKIVKKKKYVKNVLMANFEFIQSTLRNKQRNIVNDWIK